MNKLKSFLRGKQLMKLKYMLAYIFEGGGGNYLRRKQVFSYYGQGGSYQSFKLNNEPKLLKIHNNVVVAEGVTFYTHDGINHIFRKMDNDSYRDHGSCVEIFDNCFIGGKSIIVGNVSIGPNAIVAAGAVVTKDVPEGVIVGGNPAKVIGSFEDLHNRRAKEDKGREEIDLNSESEVNRLWKAFEER